MRRWRRSGPRRSSPACPLSRTQTCCRGRACSISSAASTPAAQSMSSTTKRLLARAGCCDCSLPTPEARSAAPSSTGRWAACRVLDQAPGSASARARVSPVACCSSHPRPPLGLAVHRHPQLRQPLRPTARLASSRLCRPPAERHRLLLLHRHRLCHPLARRQRRRRQRLLLQLRDRLHGHRQPRPPSRVRRQPRRNPRERPHRQRHQRRKRRSPRPRRLLLTLGWWRTFSTLV